MIDSSSIACTSYNHLHQNYFGYFMEGLHYCHPFFESSSIIQAHNLSMQALSINCWNLLDYYLRSCNHHCCISIDRCSSYHSNYHYYNFDYSPGSGSFGCTHHSNHNFN